MGPPGGPGKKRKRSSLRRRDGSLPMGLPRAAAGGEKTSGRRASPLARPSGLGVVGSQSTGTPLERKVISNRLSWDPTDGGTGVEREREREKEREKEKERNGQKKRKYIESMKERKK